MAAFYWHHWRIQHITRRFFHWFKSRLPELSVTEKIALAAGDRWWEADLLNGKPDWKKLHDLPIHGLTAEEQLFIQQKVSTLCEMIDDWQLHQQQCLPDEIWEYLKTAGFWALQIPKQYGGLEFSARAHSLIISKIASRSVSVAVPAMVPNSLGPAELLLHYGTEAQKQYYLPRLASGEEIPCFALTGLEVGSDASSMPDSGIVCYGHYQDKLILGIRLSWEKRYITLAPIATLLGVAFKLYDPEHLLGNKEEIGITLCLIPTNHPGVEVGKMHRPMGLVFPNGPTRGKEVFIPLDYIIGGVSMAGQGWRMLMECLSVGRGISLPALSNGISQLCYRSSGAYAAVRKQFKQPIGKFEGVSSVLARIGGFNFMIEAARIFTVAAVDHKVKPTIASAIAKYHLTEMARQIINDAMDIHAGRAIQTGPRNYLTMGYLGAPMSVTVEGSNILTRNLIIFGQGAIHCHRFLKQEIDLLSYPESPSVLAKFDKILWQHIFSGMQHLGRTLLGGLTAGYCFKFVDKEKFLKRYYQQCQRMSSALALVSDITLLLLGGELKRKEFLSARLGDILSHLYLASAVLKYVDDANYLPEMQCYVEWALNYQLAQIQHAFDELFNNFPCRWLGRGLRWIVFPWGRSYAMPSDDLSRQVADTMLRPSVLRDRLSENCYISHHPHDALRRVEYALSLQATILPIEKKLVMAQKAGAFPKKTILAERLTIAVAQGVLSEAEAALMRQYEEARLEAIKVDEF